MKKNEKQHSYKQCIKFNYAFHLTMYFTVNIYETYEPLCCRAVLTSIEL